MIIDKSKYKIMKIKAKKLHDKMNIDRSSVQDYLNIDKEL